MMEKGELNKNDKLKKYLIFDGTEMKTAWHQPYRLVVVLMIAVGMFIGCASVFQHLDDRMHTKQFKLDHEAFKNALAFYDEGDYTKALARFKTLSTASTNNTIARQAWLGEICCHLMLAETHTEYTAAIGKWFDFRKMTPEKDTAWDLALIDPLVVRMTPKKSKQMVETQLSVKPPSSETTVPAKEQQDSRQIQAELADLKKKLKQAAQLQQQMDKIETENRSLREKIKALEAIDQKIQKKKTEIATPSE